MRENKVMLIETRNLTKKFSGQIAVDSVDIHIEKGDIYGLVGQNGAGKTTLMNIIVGSSHPTSGEIILFGSQKRNMAQHKIGALIEHPGLFLNESALENMRRYAIISNIKEDSSEAIGHTLKLVNLSNTGKKKVKHFSLGMKQRLGIAIALMGNPALLVLDEPTNGLDPIGIKEMRELLLKLNENGTTIFISSHTLDELARVATKYGFMRKGNLLEEITATELTERCTHVLKLKVSSVDEVSKLIDVYYPHASYFCEKDIVYLLRWTSLDVDDFISKLETARVKSYEKEKVTITIEQYFINKVG